MPATLARFHALPGEAATQGTLVKLTLGKPRSGAADATLAVLTLFPIQLLFT